MKKEWKKILKAVLGSFFCVFSISLNAVTIQYLSSKIFFIVTGIILYFIFLEFFEMQEKLNKKEKENEK